MKSSLDIVGTSLDIVGHRWTSLDRATAPTKISSFLQTLYDFLPKHEIFVKTCDFKPFFDKNTFSFKKALILVETKLAASESSCNAECHFGHFLSPRGRMAMLQCPRHALCIPENPSPKMHMFHIVAPRSQPSPIPRPACHCNGRTHQMMCASRKPKLHIFDTCAPRPQWNCPRPPP